MLFVFAMTIHSTAVAAKDDKRAAYIRYHYTKFEYQLPMRDGVKLFTTVYMPNDSSKPYPIMLQRTPYRSAPYGANLYKKKLGPTHSFEKEKFIFVFQDVRGKYMSHGEFVNVRSQNQGGPDDATDAWDTIDWLVKNIDNNNQKVALWGNSYKGYYASVGTINAHPALKAVSPQAPIADWYFDDFHRNGAFVLPMAFSFFDSFDKKRPGLHRYALSGMSRGTPDGYDFFRKLGPLSNVNKHYFKGERPFWNDLVAHPNYDEFCQDRNILPHLSDTKPAVLVVGGWYDSEDPYGALATYQAMTANKKQNEHIKLVMGPWRHTQWNRAKGDTLGEANFGMDTSKWFQENIQLPFFKHHLKGKKAPNLARATVFETGANRWRYLDEWPPKSTHQQQWQLADEEKLLTARQSKPQITPKGFSEYISDPNKPVPYSAGIDLGWGSDFMVEDQRFAARRSDVLVFNSEVLINDNTIAGIVEVDLWISTSQTSADFVVKLIDVFPSLDLNKNKTDRKTGNRHELVRWGVLRGRYRTSLSQPKPFTPNKPTKITVKLDDILHTFKAGHRVQIQIQSSFFPFIDLNPQHYVDNIFKAKATDFVKATHKVYHNKDFPSVIRFTLLDN